MNVAVKNTGIRRIWLAFGYSVKGVVATFKSEAAFRQETFLLLFAIPLALWIGDNLLEKVLLIAVVLLVLIIELVNSAIESLVERYGNEFHELAGRAKDQGSAAVLLALLIAVLVWAAVLLD